jgi:murein DD-endopeptidase MepM/ murein hydrolase activator NlpD
MRTIGIGLLAAWALQATPAAPPLTVTAAARAMQPGELVVLTISGAAPVTAVKATAFQRSLAPFQVDERTWQVLAGIDLTMLPGTYTASITATVGGRASKTSYSLKVAAKAFPTRTLKVDNAFVDPPESAAARIADDAKDLERCWASPSADKLWMGPFARPVPHPANSAFGSRSVFNGQPRNPHSGADFSSPTGTPVKAPNAGRIVLAKDLYFSGGTVVIDHGLGLFSLFAHLSSIDVADGASVTTGDVVGRVGATGRVTGAHLHWMVRAGGARVDPLSLLHVMGR